MSDKHFLLRLLLLLVFVGVALDELHAKVVGFGCGQSGEQAKGLGFKISAATHLSPP